MSIDSAIWQARIGGFYGLKFSFQGNSRKTYYFWLMPQTANLVPFFLTYTFICLLSKVHFWFSCIAQNYQLICFNSLWVNTVSSKYSHTYISLYLWLITLVWWYWDLSWCKLLVIVVLPREFHWFTAYKLNKFSLLQAYFLYFSAWIWCSLSA